MTRNEQILTLALKLDMKQECYIGIYLLKRKLLICTSLLVAWPEM